MKKLFKALICAGLIMSLVGCGGKTAKLTNEEIYSTLKDNGYSFDLSSYAESSYMLEITGTLDITYTDTGEVNLMFVDNSSGAKLLADKTVPEGEPRYMIFTDSCELQLKSGEYSNCSSTQKTDIKDFQKSLDSILSELKINHEDLFSFCIWYVNENKDKITVQDDNDLFNLEEHVKQLGYSKTEDDIYMKKTSDSFSDYKAEVYMFSFDRSQFAVKLENVEKIVVIDWVDGTVTLSDYDGTILLYDVKNYAWIEKESDIVNETKAINFWTAFVQYCTKNNILIDIK